MNQQHDEATLKAMSQIEKLMRLAGNNPNEHEASLAMAKAQALLAEYNLDVSAIEMAGGASGKRTEEMVSGGLYKYQRALWRSIAELNFCMYWNQKVRLKDDERTKHRANGYRNKRKVVHRLIGRTVNVASTKAMASYLEGTINRLTAERTGPEGRHVFSTWAIAYREGIADRVMEKIRDRRQEVLDEEERKEREARKAGAAGVSLGTTLTVASVTKSEEAANYDFLHGEGAWAKKEAREAEWAAGWEKRREARAKVQREAEVLHAAWAKANPEEAAREARREAAAERRRLKREAEGRGRRYSFRQSAEDMRKESGAYYAGLKKGDDVSLDQQMDRTNQKRIGR